ncbi:MAG: UDP-glucose/GDP-mannose dehydrogenase family protein [Actinomycetota bacterium]|nr:UDP-glucose/GDP-mannose dehydrogenase family protein [Actinomycetota bacterium]MCL6093949.1 UDP-glucose/GDP-mannose dehydrogenase family protein [Actinomycetota bacterium]MDA8166838.1 UDP-glucose/GDP-mannose dehydrogenase family protein [Actinomycetota bacterium]
MSSVGIIGIGYVGLVTATCLAELGNDVVCMDIDAEKIASLREGKVPIFEPGLPELVVKNRERMHFTTSLDEIFEKCEIVFIAVDTPPSFTGDADLSRVFAVISALPGLSSGQHILVMKSTVPVGTGLKISSELARQKMDNIAYVSNPEFLREGSAIGDFLNPDRVVIGSREPEASERVAALYTRMKAPILKTNIATAEMIKYASNAFLATKISFINEIANVCEEIGADVTVVAEGMGYDARIGKHFLQAGIGYGGSCFPKDVAALKQIAGNSGYHFQLLTAVIEVNELQKRRVVNKLKKHLGPLNDKTVALLGLAFKPNTNDLREASSIVLASRLLGDGAYVKAYDPVAIPDAARSVRGVLLCDDVLTAVENCDAAVLVTEWEEFAHLPLAEMKKRMRHHLIIDGRNFLNAEEIRAAGFTYEGIGHS